MTSKEMHAFISKLFNLCVRKGGSTFLNIIQISKNKIIIKDFGVSVSPTKITIEIKESFEYINKISLKLLFYFV